MEANTLKSVTPGFKLILNTKGEKVGSLCRITVTPLYGKKGAAWELHHAGNHQVGSLARMKKILGVA